jgi:diacylglycerol kinase (ATP)
MKAIYCALINSLRGMRYALSTERAVRQEFIVLILSIPAAAFLSKDVMSFAAMVGSIVFLISIELINTSIENLCDYLHPHHHKMIGSVKDLGSAAVLFAAILAALIWATVLLQSR